jgi:polysaccharide biosynthesis protein PelA
MRRLDLRLSATSCVAWLVMIGSADAATVEDADSWAFAIGNGHLNGDAQAVGERLGEFDAVVIDGEEARAADVTALHDRGATVLGYLSVGTIEKWRGWYERVKRFRLAAWQDWRDEWFADVSRARLRRILAGDVAPAMLAKGFDGLFLDNVDMIEARRHRAQRSGMRKLVARLEGLLGETRLLFAQNGFWGLRRFRILEHLDGWNREDVTWTYDFDRRRYVRSAPRETRWALDELERAAGRGLFTTATDYTAVAGGAAAAQAVENACGVGALPYVADIGLTARRLPDPPLVC